MSDEKKPPARLYSVLTTEDGEHLVRAMSGAPHTAVAVVGCALVLFACDGSAAAIYPPGGWRRCIAAPNIGSEMPDAPPAEWSDPA